MARYTAGSVEVKVTPDLDGLHKAIARVTNTVKAIKIPLDVDTTAAEAKIAKITRPRSVKWDFEVNTTKAAAAMKAVQAAIDGPNRGFHSLMVNATRAAVAIVALGSSANMIGGLGAALAAASGAALLLPGAIGAGIAAAAALKLGFAGIGDAMSAIADGDAAKLEAAIAKLAPSAQAFVRTVASMRGEFVALQQSVQGALFNNLATPFREMATAVLPVLKAGLTGIAAEFNTIAQRAMLFFTQAGVLRDMGAMFEGTRVIVRNLGEAFTPLMRVFTTIAAVAIPVIAQLTGGVGAAAQGFAVFMENARATGQLEAWIRNGVAAFGDLFATIGNIGGIIAEVFGAANTHGASFLSVLREVTGQVRSFLASAQGQELLNTIFSTLRATIDALWPGIQALAGALLQIVTAVAPSLPALGAAFSAVAMALAPMVADLLTFVAQVIPPLAAFVTEHPAGFLFLAGAVSAVAFAVKGFIALSAGVQAMTAAYHALKIATIAQTVAQWAQNAAWLANPVVWIVIAIVAAIAGLVAAAVWAYNNIGWFRDGVNAAFEGIMVAVRAVGDFFVWLWQSVIVPAWNAIGAAISWAWNNVLKPIFDAIGFAISILGAILFTLLVAPFIVAWNLISAAFMWAWDAVIKPVFGWIAEMARWLWDNALSPVFGWIAAGWDALMAGIRWVWDNVLKPCWDAIAAAARWLWDNVLMPVFGFIGQTWNNLLTGIRVIWDTVLKPCWDAIAAAANWLWNNVLKPVFDLIGAGWSALMAGIRWVYDNVLRPCFDAVKGAVDSVGRAFDTTVNWIRDVWNTIKGILAKPINFVIDTVYNNGIKKTWDTIAGWLKIPGLPHVAPIQEFATGGRVRDITRGGKIPGSGNRDTVPGMLMPGEYVFSKKAVQSLGMDNLHATHMAARSGATPQYFANGGPVHTWEQMSQIAQGMGMRVTSAYRDRIGHSGYHGKGQAIDIVPEGAGSAQRLFEKFPNATQIISAQWRGGLGVLNGRPHNYVQDNPDHFDHVHWAMTPEAMGGAAGGGVFGNIIDMVVSWFRDTLMKPVMDSAAGLIPKFGDNAFTGGINKIPGAALDVGTDWVKTKADAIFPNIMQFFGNLFGGFGGGGGGNGGSGVQQWRGVVLQALSMMGQPASLADTVLRRMNQESGGNARAINNWDSNASKGTPSKGLMQVIDPTFRSYMMPGFGNIWAPLDNVLASMRYAMARYGSLPAAYNRPGGYAKGGPVVKPSLFDNGGILPPTPNGYGLYANHSGRNEAVLTNEQMRWLRSAADNGTSGTPVTVNNNIETRVDASPEAIAQATTRLARRAFRGA